MRKYKVASWDEYICHIDMDAFYAAVEQRDNDELKGKPVIISGCSKRSVVSTCSYEARRYGVKSAMSYVEAVRRCPHAYFIAPNIKKYCVVSEQIYEIFSRFTDRIEVLSLDEAFLDLSGLQYLYESPLVIAKTIKATIKKELKLTASAGLAANKSMAKIASDQDKPDGLVIIRRGSEREILQNFDVGVIFGIGKVAREKCRVCGINKVLDLQQAPDKLLYDIFGKQAVVFRELSLGVDKRKVLSSHEVKSIGREVTFADDLSDYAELWLEILALIGEVGWQLRRNKLWADTVTVKIKHADFRTETKQHKCEQFMTDDVIISEAKTLLAKFDIRSGVRLIGVSVSGFKREKLIENLFTDESEANKAMELYNTIDKLRDKFGFAVVKKAAELKNRENN